MESLKTCIDWAVLAACMAAALILVFAGFNAVETSDWVRASRGHAAMGILGLVLVLATVKCAFLIGAGVCKTRRERRLGAR